MNTEKKTTYIAKFTTKTTIRISHKKFVSASAYVNQKTGEVRNETFSSKKFSPPPIAGIFSINNRRAYRSYKKYCRAMRKNEMLREIWKIETVEV